MLFSTIGQTQAKPTGLTKEAKARCKALILAGDELEKKAKQAQANHNICKGKLAEKDLQIKNLNMAIELQSSQLQKERARLSVTRSIGLGILLFASASIALDVYQRSDLFSISLSSAGLLTGALLFFYF